MSKILFISQSRQAREELFPIFPWRTLRLGENLQAGLSENSVYLVKPQRAPRLLHLKENRGFTLLELLVVIAIIGIITGVSVLAFGAIAQRRLAAEAGRLQLAFNQAEDAALFQHQIIGWFYNGESNAYSFQQWLQIDDQEPAWTDLPRGIFSSHTLNPKLRLTVDTDEEAPASLTGGEKQDSATAEEPALLFLNSGEYTPFELRLEDDSGRTVRLTGDGFNSIRIKEGEP